jgi:hypothetical protein
MINFIGQSVQGAAIGRAVWFPGKRDRSDARFGSAAVHRSSGKTQAESVNLTGKAKALNGQGYSASAFRRKACGDGFSLPVPEIGAAGIRLDG